MNLAQSTDMCVTSLEDCIPSPPLRNKLQAQKKKKKEIKKQNDVFLCMVPSKLRKLKGKEVKGKRRRAAWKIITPVLYY